MAGVKPWQIVVMLLAVLAVCGATLYQCTSDRIVLADSAILADVQTGELFKASFPKKGSVFYPAKNPGTKTDTLYPVFEKDGKWFLFDMYKSGVGSLKSAPALADPKTGEIKASGVPKAAQVF